MKEKDKFLKFFKEDVFFKDITEFCEVVSFLNGRIKLSLEDDDWDDICFDVHISDNNNSYVYLTCVTKVKELKQLLKGLKCYDK